MQVTNVRVSFLREKQPVQYEKAAPAVELVANLDDGEDHRKAARSLMMDAATIVYAGIGYDVPEKVAAALADGDVPADLSVTTKTSKASPEAPEEAPEATEEKPKARGRPKGSKNTAPKKETAKQKREREEAEAAASDAIPGDEPAISTGDARVGPDDDPSDHDEVPGEEEKTEVEDTEFTSTDLHEMMMAMIHAVPRELSIVNAKQILAHFKVARAGDLTSEQALKGKAMIEEMAKAEAAQKTTKSDDEVPA
jgi:hypothetical protein